jgi:hypothetical protein
MQCPQKAFTGLVIPTTVGIQEELTAIDHRTVKDSTHLSHIALPAVSFCVLSAATGLFLVPGLRRDHGKEGWRDDERMGIGMTGKPSGRPAG